MIGGGDIIEGGGRGRGRPRERTCDKGRGHYRGTRGEGNVVGGGKGLGRGHVIGGGDIIEGGEGNVVGGGEGL